MSVDVVFLSRDRSDPRPDVWKGICDQAGVDWQLHRLIGAVEPGDRNRYETICRARNQGRSLGTRPYVLLLDDDVVLERDCVARLLGVLKSRPEFAAVAADSAGEMSDGLNHWDYPPHVGMACVLIRRERLQQVTFRWEEGKCECRCCCDDLRRAGHGMGYVQGAWAWHRPLPSKTGGCAAPCAPVEASPPRVLAAFDRRHLRLFQRRFLRTLRNSGNAENVTAVTYGLYPSERRMLASTPGVEVFEAEFDGHPAQRRLRDFQNVIRRWPESTPVAYWDAADILFQGRLDPLWEKVRSNPDRLLAVTELMKLEDSTVARDWVETIADPIERKRAFELMVRSPILNSGFAAGTVAAMLRYLRGAEEIFHSKAFAGSSDWGDQTCMNLYCHSHPEHWLQVPSCWNYVLIGVHSRDYSFESDGTLRRLDGEPLYVVHGAGRSIKHLDLMHLTN